MAMRRHQEEGEGGLASFTSPSALFQMQGFKTASKKDPVKAPQCNKNTDQVPFAVLVNSLTDGKTFLLSTYPSPASAINLCLLPGSEMALAD